jgi:phosphatidate cytidylyltransferase
MAGCEAAMSKTGAPPSSDLTTRFAAGVAMIAVASVLIYLGGWWFRLLVLAAAAAMLAEWAALKRAPRWSAHAGAALLALLLLGGAEYLFPAGSVDLLATADGGTIAGVTLESLAPTWTGFGAAVLLGLLLGLATRRAAMAWGFVYIAVPAFALLVMSWAWYGLVFWVMLVTWSTDIFAYFAGRTIGGPKLAPRISPNKTWAGLIGGVMGAALVGWFAARTFDLDAPFHLLGAPMAVLAQLGDLYESWEKRRAGVKDSGSILPGHGGILDRADGLLAVAFATMLVLLAGAWTQ